MSDTALDKYALPGLVTLAGFGQCAKMAYSVGYARRDFKVEPPATTGPDEFNRIFRAQQNHLEFFPLATGGLWLGAVFLHPVPSSLLYAGWLFGRHKFFTGYAESVDKRVQGFKISVRLLKLLWLVAALGIGHRILRHAADIDLFEKLKDALPELD